MAIEEQIEPNLELIGEKTISQLKNVFPRYKFSSSYQDEIYQINKIYLSFLKISILKSNLFSMGKIDSKYVVYIHSEKLKKEAEKALRSSANHLELPLEILN